MFKKPLNTVLGNFPSKYISLCVFVLFLSITFNGKTENLDNFTSPFNFNVYLSVSCEENGTRASIVKGYLIEEMRKIPDITTVKKGSEIFRIEILLMETEPAPGIAYSICILSRLDISIFTPHIREDEASQMIIETLLKNRLYALEGHLIGTSSFQGIPKLCKDIILVFNSDNLEPTRQLFRNAENWLNKQDKGEQ